MGCAASKPVEPTQPGPGPIQRPKTEVGAGARHTHAPLTPEVHALSEEHSSGKGVSIEALQLLSQLDEQKLIRALESEDIRLGRREWLLAQPDDYRLQKPAAGSRGARAPRRVTPAPRSRGRRAHSEREAGGRRPLVRLAATLGRRPDRRAPWRSEGCAPRASTPQGALRRPGDTLPAPTY